MTDIPQVLTTVEALIGAVTDAQDDQPAAPARFSVSTPAERMKRIHRLRLLLSLQLEELSKGPEPLPLAKSRPRRR